MAVPSNENYVASKLIGNGSRSIEARLAAIEGILLYGPEDPEYFPDADARKLSVFAFDENGNPGFLSVNALDNFVPYALELDGPPVSGSLVYTVEADVSYSNGGGTNFAIPGEFERIASYNTKEAFSTTGEIIPDINDAVDPHCQGYYDGLQFILEAKDGFGLSRFFGGDPGPDSQIQDATGWTGFESETNSNTIVITPPQEATVAEPGQVIEDSTDPNDLYIKLPSGGFFSILRGVIAKAGSIFGIYTPWLYGAAGDGTTDDRVAIQNAINACGAAGGGEVRLGSKTYRLTKSPAGNYCLLMPHNAVSLVGNGMSRLACDDEDATTILVAKDEGPYDSNTEWVDGCRVTNLYFNPLVQKENNALEIHVPYSRNFIASGLKFGRYDGLVSFIDGLIPADEESKIGTFAKLGDLDAPISSDMIVENCRGFGYYRSLNIMHIADIKVSNFGGDANRNDSQSVHLIGAVEFPLFKNSQWVNSMGVGDGTFDSCLLIEPSGGRYPRWGKFVNCGFDSHKRAIQATAGYSFDFSNCYLSGKNAPGVQLYGTADQFRFSNCQANDNRQEAFFIESGSHTIRDTECTGVAQVESETASRASIYIGPATGVVTLDNVTVKTSVEVSPSNELISLHIAPGPKRVNIIGGEYYNGILDLSGLVNDVPASSIQYWLRPSSITPSVDGRLMTRWPNSIASRKIGRAHTDSARPAFRANVGGVPCMEFGKGGRTGSCLRLHDDVAGSDTALLLTNFTVTALVKLTGNGAILGKEDNNWNFRLSSAGIMSVRWAQGAGTTVSSDTALTTPMGEWVLLTWRQNGTVLEFFENGVLIDTQSAPDSSTNGLLINQIGGFNGSEFPVGYIAEIVIQAAAESDPSLAALSLAIMNQYPSVFSV